MPSACLTMCGGGWERHMHTQMRWIHTLALVGLLGLPLAVAEAGNAQVSSPPPKAVAQDSAIPGSSSDAMSQELEQLKRLMQSIQDRIQQLERQQLEKAAPAPETPATTPPAPAPSYGNILPGVRVGGYGSFRFESSNLQEVNDTFTFRRFVLTADAAIAERLRSAIELEFERFTSLELER